MSFPRKRESLFKSYMVKPFLILQLRPVDKAADGEFEAYLKYAGLTHDDVHRVRMEKEGVPDLNLDDYSGVIVGGGPSNISDDEEIKAPEQKKFEKELKTLMEKVVGKDFPYFGNCYGYSVLVKQGGGKVSKEKFTEPVHTINLTLRPEAELEPLLDGLPKTFRGMVGHKEACQILPEGAVWLISGEACPYQMFRLKQNMFGSQFHTELDTQGICERIDIYKNKGYFPPEDAEKLKAEARKENITEPMKILKKFVERYRQ
jgi:GMP synthase (glutamine-hydrolysing)